MNYLDLTGPKEGRRQKGAAPYEALTFPDGQPHLAATLQRNEGTTIRSRISSTDDLIRVLLAAEMAHRNSGWGVRLDVTYLLGARMDRRMPVADGKHQPFTLKVIADVLKTGDFRRIRVLDPHSDVACALLDAEAVLPTSQVGKAMAAIEKARPAEKLVVVAPDAGAAKRTAAVVAGTGWTGPVVQCFKKRDEATGKLSGFGVADGGPLWGANCLIVDDLIDGGRTFSGIAAALRNHGARSVSLYATHAIFSNGFAIDGVDKIVVTDSYRPWGKVGHEVPEHVTVLPATF